MKLGKLILDEDRKPILRRFLKHVLIENMRNGSRDMFIIVKANNNTISLDESTRIYITFPLLNAGVVRAIHINTKSLFKK